MSHNEQSQKAITVGFIIRLIKYIGMDLFCKVSNKILQFKAGLKSF